MGDRAAKLRSLDEFRRAVPHVSPPALSRIPEEAASGLSDRSAIREAGDVQLTQVTPYGAVLDTLELRTVGDEVIPMTCINPFAQLYVAAEQCEGFADLLADRIRVHPPSDDSPWGFVIYADEVVPGNPMGGSQQTKGVGDILLVRRAGKRRLDARGRMVLRRSRARRPCETYCWWHWSNI